MEWVETTGKSVEDAKESALDQLGVVADDAEFEVVNDARTGLFGRLKEEARVRARVRPAAPRSKETANKRRSKPRRNASTNNPEETRPSSTTTSAEPPRSERSPRTNKRRRSEETAATSTTASQSTFRGDDMGDVEVPLEEQGKVAQEFLAGLMTEIRQQVTFEAKVIDGEDLIEISMTGDQLGHLIGPRGSTLHSLQDLARTVVQRKTGSRTARVVIDISQYRVKRREALAAFTRQAATSVLANSTAQALEPMNPADRKIVHDTANDIEGVVTSSEGEEPRRYVVIKPEAS